MFKLLKKIFKKQEEPAMPAKDYHQVAFSGDITKQRLLIDMEADVTDRHFLLQNIAEITYKNRTNAEDKELLYRVCEVHWKLLEEIVAAFLADMKMIPSIPIVKRYVMVLTEDQRYSEAISICEKAQQLGLHDGTKGNYEGRIKRIQKSTGL
ncbi:MAG: hypothetical protein ACNI27_07045 [Desulfovibrio sp.]